MATAGSPFGMGGVAARRPEGAGRRRGPRGGPGTTQGRARQVEEGRGGLGRALLRLQRICTVSWSLRREAHRQDHLLQLGVRVSCKRLRALVCAQVSCEHVVRCHSMARILPFFFSPQSLFPIVNSRSENPSDGRDGSPLTSTSSPRLLSPCRGEVVSS